jgi:hypothetical protein
MSRSSAKQSGRSSTSASSSRTWTVVTILIAIAIAGGLTVGLYYAFGRRTTPSPKAAPPTTAEVEARLHVLLQNIQVPFALWSTLDGTFNTQVENSPIADMIKNVYQLHAIRITGSEGSAEAAARALEQARDYVASPEFAGSVAVNGSSSGDAAKDKTNNAKMVSNAKSMFAKWFESAGIPAATLQARLNLYYMFLDKYDAFASGSDVTGLTNLLQGDDSDEFLMMLYLRIFPRHYYASKRVGVEINPVTMVADLRDIIAKVKKDFASANAKPEDEFNSVTPKAMFSAVEGDSAEYLLFVLVKQRWFEKSIAGNLSSYPSISLDDVTKENFKS